LKAWAAKHPQTSRSATPPLADRHRHILLGAKTERHICRDQRFLLPRRALDYPTLFQMHGTVTDTQDQVRHAGPTTTLRDYLKVRPENQRSR
jgi:hypothetical protein